jgi:hypothetical protein
VQKSYVVYGPQGCGKTGAAERLRKAFGLDRVIDPWEPGQPFPLTGALVLTQRKPPGLDGADRRVMPFDDALRLARELERKGNARPQPHRPLYRTPKPQP